MSSSANFKISVNEGRIDRILRLTPLLNKRIENIISMHTALEALKGDSNEEIIKKIGIRNRRK